MVCVGLGIRYQNTPIHGKLKLWSTTLNSQYKITRTGGEILDTRNYNYPQNLTGYLPICDSNKHQSTQLSTKAKSNKQIEANTHTNQLIGRLRFFD